MRGLIHEITLLPCCSGAFKRIEALVANTPLVPSLPMHATRSLLLLYRMNGQQIKKNIQGTILH